MKRSLIFALLLGLFSGNISAQRLVQSNTTTGFDFNYLKLSEVANSKLLLPPPPTVKDSLFMLDCAYYYWGKKLRDTPRGDQAAMDAELDGDGVPNAFSEAFGITITQELTPEIYRLIIHMREDAGDLATRHAKEYYERVRPFVHFKEDTCNPTQQTALSTNGSYPSGHTCIGWATALILAEINPDRQNEILKRGYEIGESRVICGYHWKSDVEAARLVAAAVVARLHANEAFFSQLSRAKAEFSRLKRKGLVEPSLIH